MTGLQMDSISAFQLKESIRNKSRLKTGYMIHDSYKHGTHSIHFFGEL